MKEDKRRAKEQYDAFHKLETVGYCFDREQISSFAAESWTSKREILCTDICFESFCSGKVSTKSDTKHHKS